MQGLQRYGMAAALAAALSISLSAHASKPELHTGAITRDHSVQLISDRGLERHKYSIRIDGATFVKVHFSEFSLPAGFAVEVSNPDGSETYRYSGRGRDSRTLNHDLDDDGHRRFSAMSISGDTAIVRVLGDPQYLVSGLHRLSIDQMMLGLPHPEEPLYTEWSTQSGKGGSSTRSTCGINERYEAACYADSNPQEFDRSRPVAKIITARGEVCTAWRVGPENRMFTAQHCIEAQSDLDGAEIWFNFQRSECSGDDTATEVKVTGNTLLALDETLDFALFTVNDFSSIESFGYFGLEPREATLGERIFIPQHGRGLPKQLAIESDMNLSGLCEIDDADHYGYAEGSDLGYYCDTTTSSSGSPVVAASGNVIALHHLGGCFNSGTKISRIWPLVESHFGNVVPEGDAAGPPQPVNQAPEARFSHVCEGNSCTFDAGSSSDSDGSVVSFSWTFGDGEESFGSSVSHNYSSVGIYDVRLTVTDNGGNSDTENKSITLTLPTERLEAAFTYSCKDLVCEFDASSSAGNPGRYSWKFGDRGRGSGIRSSYAFSEAGTHRVQLSVYGSGGAFDREVLNISVGEETSGGSDGGAEITPDEDGAGAGQDDGSSEDSGDDQSGASENDLKISLEVEKGRFYIWSAAKLSWSGAEGRKVAIYRNGRRVTRTRNDGNWMDLRFSRHSGTVVYQVCETSGNECSAEIEYTP